VLYRAPLNTSVVAFAMLAEVTDGTKIVRRHFYTGAGLT
jgi:hypothetical protein